MVQKSEKIDKLVKAVTAVMKAINGVEKNSQVGSGSSSYKGTKDQDVKLAFKDIMADNGLAIMPIHIDEKTKVYRWQEEVRYGNNPAQMKTKQSVFTKATVTYILMHESDQWIEVQGFGHGIDTQDKGAGKVTTYALKNLLLYSFLTPVGDIDDTDTTHSNDHATPQQPQQQPQQQQKAEPVPLVKDDKNWKAIVTAIDSGQLKSLDKLKVVVSDELKAELQKMIDKKKPKLVKDSEEWDKAMDYIKDGKLKTIDQLLRQFQITKALQKEIQKIIDDKQRNDAIAEQVAKEQGQANEEENGRLPALNEDAFQEALKLTDKAEITKILNTHRMAQDQRDQLTAKLK